MGEATVQHLQSFLNHYGYWAVFLGVFVESAGIPVPGETILIIASVASRRGSHLNLYCIGGVAVVAAITGDNLGFALGRYGGQRLLRRFRSMFHIRDSAIQRAEALFDRHGDISVVVARFIAGIRVLIGPLAWVLRMKWSRFLLFNALGATAWVAVVVGLAYYLGAAFEGVFHRAGWLIALVMIVLAVHLWRSAKAQNNASANK